MLAVHCGTVAYADALRWQHLLARARQEDAVDDVLLTLEHDRVYTAGRHADLAAHVLDTRGIPVVEVDRGGDVTYHGPGQLVAYPIVRLRAPRAVRAYVEALEEACVRTAADFGVSALPAGRGRPGDRGAVARTGVWVDGHKLAAIGVRVDRGVTTHGLAFNVTTDLADFAGIVPCGIADAGVCSLASLGVDTSVADVRGALVGHLGHTLERPVQDARPVDLGLVAA